MFYLKEHHILFKESSFVFCMKVLYKNTDYELIVHDVLIGKSIICRGDEYEVENPAMMGSNKPRYLPDKTFQKGMIKDQNLFMHLYSNIETLKKRVPNKRDTNIDSALGKIRGLENQLRQELSLPERKAAENKIS